jgi:hypothetical protein
MGFTILAIRAINKYYGTKCEMNSRLKIINKVYYTSILLLIFLSLPFVFICLIAGRSYKIAMAVGVSGGLFFFFVAQSLKSSKIINAKILLVYLIKIVALSFLMVIHCDIKYIDEIIITVTSIIVISASIYPGIEKIEYYILRIAVILSCFSIIALLLVAFAILPPFSFFQNPDSRISGNYILTFSNVNFPYGNGYLIRPASYFDEPGQFALFLTFCLIINFLTEKNKKIELLLIIGGLSTTSLAFLITLFLYIFLVRKDLTFIITGSIFVILFVVIITQFRMEPIVNRLASITIDRIYAEIITGNLLEDSNRASSAEATYTIMRDNLATGIGVTNIMKVKEIHGGAIWNPFATNGIFLGLMNLVPLIYLIIKLSLSKQYGIIIILLLNQMQRGLVAHILYLFLIGIIILQLDRKYGKYLNNHSNL